MPYSDREFVVESATFLAQCTPEQRTRLVEMSKNFGKPKGAADDRRPMARDGRSYESPAAGKSFDEMFPNANRLRG